MTPPKKHTRTKIKVGLIGTGIVASEHVKALRILNRNFILASAFDADCQRLEKFIKKHPEITPAKTYEEMLGDTSIDLVVVATPPSTHEALVIAALESEKYVLCEKPLSNSMSSALRIVEAAERFPGCLAVNYQLRYDAAYRRLKWICENNKIGDIRSVRIQRHSYIPHTNVGKGGWWGTWNVAGGGVLITQLIHEIDLLTLIMGKPITVKGKMDTRYTQIESEDMVDATLFFDRGRTATISASVNSGVISAEFSVCGDNGSVAFPETHHLRNSLSSLDIIRALDRALPDTRLSSTSLLSRGLGFLRRRLGIRVSPELSPHAHFYVELENCIRSGRALPVSAIEAMVSLEVCMAIYESGLSGVEVKLPLQPECRVFSGVSKVLYDKRLGTVQ